MLKLKILSNLWILILKITNIDHQPQNEYKSKKLEPCLYDGTYGGKLLDSIFSLEQIRSNKF